MRCSTTICPAPTRWRGTAQVWVNLHSIPDARARILRLLADHQSPRPLDELLPDLPEPDALPESKLRGRSRWTSTFVASLELAKQGEVVLEQENGFAPIFVHAGRAERGCSDDT